jgi:hypothetical protein
MKICKSVKIRTLCTIHNAKKLISNLSKLSKAPNTYFSFQHLLFLTHEFSRLILLIIYNLL